MTHPVDAPGRRRTIACYVAPRLFARRTRAALQGLGYHVVPVATRGRFEDASWRPDLRLVDERHLERLPREADGVPIVCLSERPEREPADPRIVGFAPRPGELSALYPLLQRALEPHPRRAPRAATRLPARCAVGDRRWSAHLLAISETGGLLDSRAELTPDLEFNLLFPLPLGRMISTRARSLRARARGASVAFHRPSAAARSAIADYVERRLAIGDP